MEEYMIIEKDKSNFQKILNQWKHEFEFEIIWMEHGKELYRALIRRWKKNE